MGKGHILYYPEGKHDILEGKELNDVLKSKVDSITKITYKDLKDLRDNSKLTPGSLYRITDYQCTTTQENTQSAGHQFDIVLLALSENKLAEEGWTMMHDNIYDVTFADGVTKKCWLYFHGDGNVNLCIIENHLGYTNMSYDDGDEMSINFETHTATCVFNVDDITEEDTIYNYFQNSNLSAWKVWYCLDNDKSKFAWADDSVDEDSPAMVGNLPRYPDGDKEINNVQYYCWRSELINRFTTSENPEIGDDLYTEGRNGMTASSTIASFTPAHEGTGLPNGRGVIYRLIDEWGNDCPYDFKNVQFVRKVADGYYDPNDGVDTWVYTISSRNDDDLIQDNSLYGYMIKTTIERAASRSSGVATLGNNVIINSDGGIRLFGACGGNTFASSWYITLFDTGSLEIITEEGAIYVYGSKVATE